MKRWVVGRLVVLRCHRSGAIDPETSTHPSKPPGVISSPEADTYRVDWSCISGVNWSPDRIVAACASAPKASMACSCSSSPAESSPASSRRLSSSRSSIRSASHCKTQSRTVSSPPEISCSTCRIWQLLGTPLISPPLSALRNVDLPAPFRPTRPYLRPQTSVTSQSEISSAPPLDTLIDSRHRSRTAGPPTNRIFRNCSRCCRCCC